ncbi:MAG TPA: hypothetical protein VJO32_13150 [Ktedonobacteraceae bacterium]|nr:hypothetical protein [Ktedonobacteraceae bacterium]
MNDFNPYYSRNSSAIHESFAPYSAFAPFIPGIQSYQTEPQSASVTVNGYLWQQKVAATESISPQVTPVNLQKEMKPRSQDEFLQKKRDLIQLLKSWREGDEQEQHETLEYLKQALDENRFSDRKLFG